jgi:hypothetical protein
MCDGAIEMKTWRATDGCGVLPLACCLPYVILGVSQGWFHYPDWMAMPVIWSIFLCPFAGVVLALIAAIGRRWWLVVAAVWAALIVLGWWELQRHPFDL